MNIDKILNTIGKIISNDSPCNQLEVTSKGLMSSYMFGTGIFERQSDLINGTHWYKSVSFASSYYNTESTLTYDIDAATWRVNHRLYPIFFEH